MLTQTNSLVNDEGRKRDSDLADAEGATDPSRNVAWAARIMSPSPVNDQMTKK